MSRRTHITALLVAPDRGLAAQFRETTSRTRAFDVMADLPSYPTTQALEAKIGQMRPDVLLLDVATDLERAGELIRYVTALRPPVYVIGLHTRNDSQAILKSLRDGATEFLYAPFDVSVQEAAVARIQRLLEPLGGAGAERGRVVVFSSAKPGAGSSTLAIQTAYALRRLAGRRVLLADFDLHSGNLDFLLRLEASQSLVDLLAGKGPIDPDQWNAVVVSSNGIDVLPAPALPYTEPVDPARISAVLEYARSEYEWVVVDLPNIFHRLSLMCVAQCDRGFLISTPDLASLHLTRRAVKLMTQLAIDSSKYQVLLNRLEGRTELSSSDLSKLFECHVDKGLPNERLRVERVHALGQPLDGASELGRAIEGLATKLIGALPERDKAMPLLSPRPVFSQS